MSLEKRAISVAPEIRAGASGKTARGYAALFNTRTSIGDWFVEELAPGAFSDTLKTADVRALVDHDTGRVIGRSIAGTLRLNEDDKGLFVEVDLPDTTDGRDLAVQLERGDISGMSFGFRVTKETWDETGDMPVRTIQAVELFEVSAVAFPAYADTEIALRSLAQAKVERDEAEKKKAADSYFRRKAESEQKFRRIA